MGRQQIHIEKNHWKAFCFAFLLFFSSYFGDGIGGELFSQNVGINTSGTAPDASTILDLNTGNTFTSPDGKGLLIPNVALTGTSDATTITSPETSLLVYNTALVSDVVPGFYYWNGSMWSALIGSAASNWTTLGNATTVDGTNFIGTTDNIPFNIKVNSIKSGRIDHLLFNNYWGYQAGLGSVSGTNNTSFGANALKGNTYGNENTAVGKDALFTQNYANGNATWTTQNVAIGYRALYNNNPTSSTNAYYNTAVGKDALLANTTGSENTFIGHRAGESITTASYNTGFGFVPQYTNISGSYNTSAGYTSASSRGSNNTGLGLHALSYGSGAGTNTANDNTAVGYQPLYYITTGASNTAFGRRAIHANLTGANNTAFGYHTLYTCKASNNCALGANAMQAGGNPQGTQNVAIGKDALFTYSYVGSFAVDNVAIGYQALYTNNPTNTTNGYRNVAVGSSALRANTTGLGNTTLGYQAGNTITTGTYNTIIGYDADASATLTNATAIGNGVTVTASNSMMLGNAAVTQWGLGVNVAGANVIENVVNTAVLTNGGVWTDASDSTLKKNIVPIQYGTKEIMKLRPVSYKMKINGKKDIGFIAQEVKKIIPEVVYGEEGKMSMSYGQLTAVLTKAIQERQQTIENLQVESNHFKTELSTVKAMIENLQQQSANVKLLKAEK